MKLRNKKTGEIVNLYEGLIRDDGEHITIKPVAVLEKCYVYDSLAELSAEWEDYEETDEYWFINPEGEVTSIYAEDDSPEGIKSSKQIGNYFKTKEEAEKAVEKLKAAKRLKEAGFRFNGGDDACISYRFDPVKWEDRLDNDFDLLFGGEE